MRTLQNIRDKTRNSAVPQYNRFVNYIAQFYDYEGNIITGNKRYTYHTNQ
ncbi:hypothetical protein [Aquimarina sp. 2201CG14-23]|nr:hypothetical protein [Aquimarina sp. 2201CG14-23]MDH7445145.1 hypothetical protein [Aquimarina sp. 2201CG14-23]